MRTLHCTIQDKGYRFKIFTHDKGYDVEVSVDNHIRDYLIDTITLETATEVAAYMEKIKNNE